MWLRTEARAPAGAGPGSDDWTTRSMRTHEVRVASGARTSTSMPNSPLTALAGTARRTASSRPITPARTSANSAGQCRRSRRAAVATMATVSVSESISRRRLKSSPQVGAGGGALTTG